MKALRKWISDVLLDASMRVRPGVTLPPGTRHFQIIAVPRRVSETEGRQLAEMVNDL